ncbi:hypothetical protein GXM_00842 [Nostoc sphaeroides CCNUC1]|uniref:Uncharacterized protein n=1 Tax=Nostoc sphaeroides CCNUC1 TaxID=2653204 RepID=A0A5P8VTY4_9NOSO|nr:hypothetical protein GXM_00842 [Nostoc sphaeroides CCNUC1]
MNFSVTQQILINVGFRSSTQPTQFKVFGSKPMHETYLLQTS